MSGGWNPVTGRDGTGARPTYAPYGSTMPSQGQPLIPHAGGPGYGWPMMPQYPNWSNLAYQPYANNYGYCGGAPYVGNQGPAGGYYAQHTISNQPNGVGNPMSRQPQAWPNIDSTMPAAQMTNSTGGTGCEPGYNYFFPPSTPKCTFSDPTRRLGSCQAQHRSHSKLSTFLATRPWLSCSRASAALTLCRRRISASS